MKQIKNKRLEFRCSQEEKEGIEELAKYLDLPTTTLVRNLVVASYKDALVFKKFGLLKGAKNILDFTDKYSSLFRKA